MKNLILCFLVFITILLKGQSVNPETFPTVVGAISNKNVYTNTGGEGKISVQSIIDSAKLISGDFIPLTGTTAGNPVSGDIEFLDGGKISVIDDKISLYSGSGAAYIKVDNTGFYVTDGTETGFTNISTNRLIFTSSEPSAKGFSSNQDFSPNITDLDYTQKIYVDTKVAKIGTDDIEITDFNKGIILTSPNSSRYRITVDNAGTLITTLIP